MGTIADLVAKCVFLSGAADPELDASVPGQLTQTALEFLQDSMDAHRNLIPYYSEKEIFTDSVSLANTSYVKISDMQYIYAAASRLRQPVVYKTLIDFNRLSPLEDFSEPYPYIYTLDPLTGTISLYPDPSTFTSLEVWGIKAWKANALIDAIPTNMPGFVQTFMRYEVASLLADFRGLVFSEAKLRARRRAYLQCVNAQQTQMSQSTETLFNHENEGAFPYFYWSVNRV